MSCDTDLDHYKSFVEHLKSVIEDQQREIEKLKALVADQRLEIMRHVALASFNQLLQFEEHNRE